MQTVNIYHARLLARWEANLREYAELKTDAELLRYLKTGEARLRDARREKRPEGIAMWELHSRVIREEQEKRA
jgi:hypothetical protein